MSQNLKLLIALNAAALQYENLGFEDLLKKTQKHMKALTEIMIKTGELK